MIESIIVPDIGEGVEAGKVVAVHMQVGGAVGIDDTIIELETDKAVVEIPSPVKGKVIEILAKENDEIKVGDVIAKVETDAAASEGDAPAPAPEPPAEVPAASAERNAAEAVETAPPQPAEPAPKAKSLPPVPLAAPAASNKEVAASPSIRRLARELGVDIYTVQGSGPGGRISEADIKTHVRAAAGTGGAVHVGGESDLPDFTRWGEVEIEPLETVRRLTALSTTMSWHTVPHVTQFDEADITALGAFVEKNAKKVGAAGGKLTVTAILTKVCAEALKKYPRFNASIDLKKDRLIFKKYIHIAMAVDTPRGLLMPVIADADTKSITQLAADIMGLAQRSRDKKVKSTELEGGTFSISNQGGIGGVAFTPIVLWPQVAILGVSRSAMKPKLVDGQFEPRNILPLSLSYDHRVIDGADAARFLRWVCDSLEQPLTMYL